MSDDSRSDVVFLLGAGASVPAGVPDTYGFAEDFLEYYRRQEHFDKLKWVFDILTEHKPDGRVDVEDLLEILHRLSSDKPDPLLWFVEINRQAILDSAAFEDIIRDLRHYIVQRGIVDEDKVRYLDPLRQYLSESESVDIVSVNYDTCVEQFCSTNKLALEDGFDLRWDPRRFDLPGTQVRLHKLHGSVTWYSTDRGSYLKLPLVPDERGPTLITGEKAENFMLYPAQKVGYEEPYLDLVHRFRRLLASESTRFLVVVGYSFRDEHITRILQDAAARNRDLQLVLIDFRAKETYNSRLRYHGQGRKPAPLYGRTICLPYDFSMVFPVLKNEILQSLRNARFQESAQTERQLKGEPANWLNVLLACANGENVEHFDSLLTKAALPDGAGGYALRLELSFKVGVALGLQGYLERAGEYLSDFLATVGKSMIDTLHLELVREPLRIEPHFGYERHGQGWGSAGNAEQFGKLFGSLFKWGQTRTSWARNTDEMVMRTIRLARDLETYLRSFVEGMTVERYKSSRLRSPHYLKTFGKGRILPDPLPDPTEWDRKSVDAARGIEQAVTRDLMRKSGLAPQQMDSHGTPLVAQVSRPAAAES